MKNAGNNKLKIAQYDVISPEIGYEYVLKKPNTRPIYSTIFCHDIHPVKTLLNIIIDSEICHVMTVKAA